VALVDEELRGCARRAGAGVSQLGFQKKQVSRLWSQLAQPCPTQPLRGSGFVLFQRPYKYSNAFQKITLDSASETDETCTTNRTQNRP